MAVARIAPDAARKRRPIFMPGLWGRLATRAGIVFLYYMAAVPAASFRGGADDFGLPIHANFNALEAIIFSDAPTRWLQAILLDHVVLQHAAVYVYGSWFMMPLIATMPLFTSERGRDHWRLLAFLMLTYYAAMPFFALYPLQPPWMHDPERVSRVIFMLRPELAGRDNNPFAAMPSLHIAIPAAAALWHGIHSRYGRFLVAYSGLIGVTILFTGDHYLADIAGGYALAGGVYLLVKVTRLPILARRPSPATEPRRLRPPAAALRRAA